MKQKTYPFKTIVLPLNPLKFNALFPYLFYHQLLLFTKKVSPFKKSETFKLTKLPICLILQTTNRKTISLGVVGTADECGVIEQAPVPGVYRRIYWRILGRTPEVTVEAYDVERTIVEAVTARKTSKAT